jgi:hypothetical protein
MKKLTILLSICLLPFLAKSQQVVFDPAVVSTLVANHTAQQGMLTQIRNEETKIAGFQATIALKMTEIKELEQKMHNSLTRVDQVITTGRNVIYASQIAQDIGRYQVEMIQLAAGDPELTLVAVKAELELINRTIDLFEYIMQASVGGDINMMSNAERMNLIRHVVDNLRIMRGMAFGIVRRMRTAKYAGVWRTISPFNTRYIDTRTARANQLLNEFRRR